MRRATPEEVDRLRREYPTHPDVPALAASLGRSYRVLLHMAKWHGIKRDPAVMHAHKLRGVAAGVKARQVKAAVTATPLDAAWRGLQP